MRTLKTLLVVAALLASACGSAAPPTKPLASALTQLRSRRPAARHALDLVPSSSAVLLHLDVARLLKSRIWQRFGPRLLARPAVERMLASLRTGCGLDLPADLQAVDLSLNADLDGDHGVFALHGRFDADKFARCLQMFDQGHISVHTQGQIAELSDQAGHTIRTAWPAPGTVVVSVGSMEGRDDLAWLDGGTAGSSGSALSDPGAEMRPDQLFTGAMLITGKLRTALGKVPIAPVALWFNVAQEQGLRVELGLRFEKEEAARALSKGMALSMVHGENSAFMARFGKDVHVEARGRDLVLAFEVGSTDVDAALDAFMASYAQDFLK